MQYMVKIKDGPIIQIGQERTALDDLVAMAQKLEKSAVPETSRHAILNPTFVKLLKQEGLYNANTPRVTIYRR